MCPSAVGFAIHGLILQLLGVSKVHGKHSTRSPRAPSYSGECRGKEQGTSLAQEPSFRRFG